MCEWVPDDLASESLGSLTGNADSVVFVWPKACFSPDRSVSQFYTTQTSQSCADSIWANPFSPFRLPRSTLSAGLRCEKDPSLRVLCRSSQMEGVRSRFSTEGSHGLKAHPK